MKILGILGAQSSSGATASMLDHVLGSIDQEVKVEKINLLDYDIRPYEQGVENKVLDELVEKMVAADVYVFASPTYFGHLSGIMKNFFDCIRNKMCTMNKDGRAIPKPEFKGKHYVSITDCFVSPIDNIFTGMTDQTFKTIDRAMMVGGVIKLDEIVACGMWKGHGQISAKKIDQCQKIGRNLAAKSRKDKNTLKRYIQLFFMVAVMALITMAIQHGLKQVINLNGFWLEYASFVVIFFILLAAILHIMTYSLHKRK